MLTFSGGYQPLTLNGHGVLTYAYCLGPLTYRKWGSILPLTLLCPEALTCRKMGLQIPFLLGPGTSDRAQWWQDVSDQQKQHFKTQFHSFSTNFCSDILLPWENIIICFKIHLFSLFNLYAPFKIVICTRQVHCLSNLTCNMYVHDRCSIQCRLSPELYCNMLISNT